MFEDSYLDSYWEDQTEIFHGDDYNLWEEEQVFQDEVSRQRHESMYWGDDDPYEDHPLDHLIDIEESYPVENELY